MRYILFLTFLSLVFAGCEKEKSQAEIDDEKILNYLSEHNLEAESHESGIYYQIIEPGIGEHPNLSSLVEVRYKGQLLDGSVFDGTKDDVTVEFYLKQLIKGWQIGIPLLKRGGKGILYIPSALGYGSSATSKIPANSVLIFELELVDFN